MARSASPGAGSNRYVGSIMKRGECAETTGRQLREDHNTLPVWQDAAVSGASMPDHALPTRSGEEGSD